MRQITINICDSQDPSVQCIHALRQVMDFFNGTCESRGAGRGLSPMGRDRKAVYAWFNARYSTDGVSLDALEK